MTVIENNVVVYEPSTEVLKKLQVIEGIAKDQGLLDQCITFGLGAIRNGLAAMTSESTERRPVAFLQDGRFLDENRRAVTQSIFVPPLTRDDFQIVRDASMERLSSFERELFVDFHRKIKENSEITVEGRVIFFLLGDMIMMRPT